MLWVKDSPSLTESSIEDIRNFIDQYQHCELPSEDDDERLRDLILCRQKHVHRDYCTRKSDGRCRFRFPKWPLKRTLVQTTNQKVTAEAREKLRSYRKLIIPQMTHLQSLSIDEYFNRINVDYDDYENCVQMNMSEPSFHQRREISEMTINS